MKWWMIQILCGIDACHRKMIVHKGLKNSNMLVLNDGVLKLANFRWVMDEVSFFWVRVGIVWVGGKREEMNGKGMRKLYPFWLIGSLLLMGLVRILNF